ncbi:two component signal transduction system histidine kinase [Thermosynechococcus sp. NK55a]|nr:two component signal transduction system histidine kinase [Thermosynechococcus sp. NK55a]
MSAFCSTFTDRDVQISVVDRGSGIPEAVPPHRCERFYRICQGQEQPRGFGLGLAIVKQIVDAHRGQHRNSNIEIQSCVGQETSVFFTSHKHNF